MATHGIVSPPSAAQGQSPHEQRTANPSNPAQGRRAPALGRSGTPPGPPDSLFEPSLPAIGDE
ncbi:hypothetical protein CALCODRAFT_504225 [Calocera cornea HHB12733]|uniref:Uncharacterized protein n=1 Tax=Calocera cornea HHB12733 TaxID=1353952 RepID=A0A165CIQ4_9BASI|nr:hypothetical protein CALCODRAFT_504225 [Calocera cornea HHB12733]